MNNLKAEDYKPKEKGISDFYSWNLYRWLRKNKGEYCEIFNTGQAFNHLIIGRKYPDGDIIGFRLKELCSGSSTVKFPQKFCYGDQEWPEVTEEFFAEYSRIGVCAIHGDMAHKWEYGGSLRGCEYCGKVERKKIKMVEVVSWE
jgi:hypothetical protein